MQIAYVLLLGVCTKKAPNMFPMSQNIGCVSLLTALLEGYSNGKIFNCLSLKTKIDVRLAQCSPNCCF